MQVPMKQAFQVVFIPWSNQMASIVLTQLEVPKEKWDFTHDSNTNMGTVKFKEGAMTTPGELTFSAYSF